MAQIPDDPEEAASFWAKDAVEGEGTRLLDITKRSRSSFEQLLSGRLWVQPPADIAEKLEKIDNHRKSPQKKTSKSPRSKPTQAENASNLAGEQVRELRKAKGWSTRKLAAEARISQSTIVLIEKGVDKGGQPISPAFQVKLKKAFGLL